MQNLLLSTLPSLLMENWHLTPPPLAGPEQEQWSQSVDDLHVNPFPAGPTWSPAWTTEQDQFPAMRNNVDNPDQIDPPIVSTMDQARPMQTNNRDGEEEHLFRLVDNYSTLALEEDQLDSSSSSNNKPEDEFLNSLDWVCSPPQVNGSNELCKDSAQLKRKHKGKIQKLTQNESEVDGKKSKRGNKSESSKERGPKLAIRTRSEVDVIEDGYKWRKYGQKAVKNSPYARSYYRCTNSKCQVKKHVERYASDPEFVVTTYDGVHNHTGPALFQITARPIFISQDTFPIPLDQLQMTASAALSLLGSSYNQFMPAQPSYVSELLSTNILPAVSQCSTTFSVCGRGDGLLEDVLPTELRQPVSLGH